MTPNAIALAQIILKQYALEKQATQASNMEKQAFIGALASKLITRFGPRLLSAAQQSNIMQRGAAAYAKSLPRGAAAEGTRTLGENALSLLSRKTDIADLRVGRALQKLLPRRAKAWATRTKYTPSGPADVSGRYRNVASGAGLLGRAATVGGAFTLSNALMPSAKPKDDDFQAYAAEVTQAMFGKTAMADTDDPCTRVYSRAQKIAETVLKDLAKH